MFFLLIYYMPAVMVAGFLAFFTRAKLPGRRREFLRALTALVVATLLAHVNRIFFLWPADPTFPSGHMTLSLGAAVSLALLRPWTLILTIPFLVLLGVGLVQCQFHSRFEVLGAIPLVALVYAITYLAWPRSAPLDSRAGST